MKTLTNIKYVFELLNKNTREVIVLDVKDLSEAITHAGNLFKLGAGYVKIDYEDSEVKSYDNEISNTVFNVGLNNWVLVRRVIRD